MRLMERAMWSDRDGPPRIAIGVPVRNEALRLPRLLSALACQQGVDAFTLCLFFDNCDDGSADLVASLAPGLPYAIVSECCDAGARPNAGAARRRAMELALRHAGDGAVLTTDADSEPASDWICANVSALDQADLVFGRIVRRAGRAPDMHDRIVTYLDRLHALRRILDPVPWEGAAHHWTSAASMACRAAVYRALGGFSPIACGEDALFADMAARAGFRVRRDAGIVVQTSSRRTGRAQHGFAATLSFLDDADCTPQTAHPYDEAWRYRMHARARALFHLPDDATLANALDLHPREIAQVRAECVNGEAFAARIVGAPPGGMRTISLTHAETVLCALEYGELAGAA